MIKSLKNVGGNLTHFCLRPKTEFGCWDLRFSVRSKIHAFCGTLLREVLILVPNQNCAKKIYAGFLPGLEITSLNMYAVWFQASNQSHLNNYINFHYFLPFPSFVRLFVWWITLTPAGKTQNIKSWKISFKGDKNAFWVYGMEMPYHRSILKCLQFKF